MLRSTEKLGGFTILATDGEIGKIDEFYFDDETWTVRYLVVETGKWLFGRKVLLSPTVMGQVNWNSETLSVSLTKEQVEKSPDIDTDKPVSRQQEIELSVHYGWLPYWTHSTPTGGAPSGIPVATPKPEAQTTLEKEKTALKEAQQDAHLRSTKEVTGYHIQASDGGIGHVEDFMVDEEVWVIRYMIVDTRNWLPGKKVLVSPQWIEGVTWSEKAVRVDLSQEALKNSPEYDPKVPIDRAYENTLYKYYGRTGYWL